jgi:hypothetical protein
VHPDTILYVKRLLLSPMRLALFLGGIVVLGAGVPLLWLWIASRIETSTLQVHYGPLAVMVLGMLATYIGAIEVAGRLDSRHHTAGPRRPMNWNRSLSADRHRERSVTSIERLFMTATIGVAVAFEVWLFVFAGSSLPSQ